MPTFLTPYLLGIKIAIALLLAAGIVGGTLYASSTYYNKKADDKQLLLDKIAQTQLLHNLQVQATFAAKLTAAGEQHAQDLGNVDILGNALVGLQIHPPICPRTTRSRTAGSTREDNAYRLALARDDKALAEFKLGMDAIGKRCATLNIDAIQHNKVCEAAIAR